MNTSAHTSGMSGDTLAQYREASERKRARRDIEAIAHDLARPAAEIEKVYTELYSDLKAHARVADYVPVFAARKVRARFR